MQSRELPVQSAAAETVLTLADCVEYALEHSPVLAQRALDHEDRLLDVLIAKSDFDFAVDYGTAYDTGDEAQNHQLTLRKKLLGNFDVATTGEIGRDHDTGNDSASWSVRISKQILGGGSYLESRKQIDDAVIDTTIALNNISREKRRLVYLVKRQFYRVIREVQSLSIQERRLERAKKNLEHARERERPLDITTAEIEVPDNQLQVIRRERSIQAAEDALKELMGMEIEEALALDLDFNFALTQVEVREDIRYATENQEDFVNNRLAREKIDTDIILQRRQIWPDVTLSAEHRAHSETDAVNLRGEDEQRYALAFSWPIGSRRDFAEYRKEKNNLQRNELDYFSLKQAKVRTLLDLSRRLAEVEQSIELQENRLDLVEFQVELFQDRWENGEIDILELVRSQNTLEDTKVELVNLKVQYLELLAEYFFEVGR